jgi:hypothetical protein
LLYFGVEPFVFQLGVKNINIYSIVLCGSEVWSLTLWGEHRLRALESMVQRRIFGQKREKGTGE